MTAHILTGQQIPKYRLIALRIGIERETADFKMFKGRSCLSIVKQDFGWKGNREKILAKLTELIDSMPATP